VLPGGNIPRREARQFLLAEKACGADSGSKDRNDGAQHRHPLRSVGKTGDIQPLRHAHVDPRTNGQPIESRAVPPSFNQHAGELASLDIEIVRPFYLDGMGAEGIEGGGERQGESKGKDT